MRHEPQLRPFAALSVGWTGYRDALPRSIRETSGSRRSPAQVPAGSAERLRSLSLPKTFAAHGIGVGGFSDCAAGLASRRSRQAWNCHLRARTDSTAQHCTALDAQHWTTALDSQALHSTGQSRSAERSTAQHWTVKICREDCQHWTTASTGQSRSAARTASTGRLPALDSQDLQRRRRGLSAAARVGWNPRHPNFRFLRRAHCVDSAARATIPSRQTVESAR